MVERYRGVVNDDRRHDGDDVGFRVAPETECERDE
jgi:hypothetical protein